MFGKVACRVCSKPLGCGLAERNWGNLKHLKTGKRSHLSGDKAQKQATVYGAACMEKSRIAQAAEEVTGLVQASRWTDADVAFNLGLENWDSGSPNVPRPIVPKRLFKAWIEDWEWDCITHKDSVAEARLLQKYGGLRWIDPDNDENILCVASTEDMEFQASQNGSGWCVVGTRDTDGGSEPWVIDVVVDLIAKYVQPAEMNVEIVFDPELRATNKEWILEEERKKALPSRRKKQQ